MIVPKELVGATIERIEENVYGESIKLFTNQGVFWIKPGRSNIHNTSWATLRVERIDDGSQG